MGYCGLKTIGDSDMASGMAHDALTKMVKSLIKSFREDRVANEFNTSGAVNVGMFVETYIVPALKKDKNAFAYVEGLRDLVEDALGDLQEEIKGARKKSEWDDEGNRLMHLNRYLELRKAMQYYLNRT